MTSNQSSLFKYMTNKSSARVVAAFAVTFLFAVSVVLAADINTSVTVGNADPSISALSFNGGSDLTLTENSSVWATSTMTVTDTNGCSDIASVSAKLYLASTTNAGTLCSYDGNNCYVVASCTATTTGNICEGGADTSVQYDCGFHVWYTATPTDSSSPLWASSIWSVSATSTDATAGTGNATNTAETIEINTLNALSLSGNIAYDATSAGSNTGAVTETITITNTGNTKIDGQFSGDVMCTDYSTCSGGAFGPEQQKFDTTDQAYSSLTYTLAATSSPANVQVNVAKPTATTTPSTQATYWGIAIPSGQTAGSYTGQNTVSAIADF